MPIIKFMVSQDVKQRINTFSFTSNISLEIKLFNLFIIFFFSIVYKSAIDEELTYWPPLVIKPSNIGSGNGLVPEGTKP